MVLAILYIIFGFIAAILNLMDVLPTSSWHAERHAKALEGRHREGTSETIVIQVSGLQNARVLQNAVLFNCL